MVGMSTIEEAIWDHVGQIVLSPPLPVAYPGVPFKPNDQPYIEVSFHPNIHQAGGISFRNPINHRGFVQANVYWPSGSGEIEPMIAADNFAAQFARGSSVFKDDALVRFEEAPDIAAPIENDGWLMVPITVAWRCLDESP